MKEFIGLRIDKETKERIKLLGVSQKRGISNMILVMIDYYLENKEDL